jgi:hypothetical protein
MRCKRYYPLLSLESRREKKERKKKRERERKKRIVLVYRQLATTHISLCLPFLKERKKERKKKNTHAYLKTLFFLTHA